MTKSSHLRYMSGLTLFDKWGRLKVKKYGRKGTLIEKKDKLLLSMVGYGWMVFSPLGRGAACRCGTTPGSSQSCAETSTIQSNKVSRLRYKIARIMNKKKCDNKQGSCEKKIQHVNSKQRLDGICRKLTMLALCLVVQC